MAVFAALLAVSIVLVIPETHPPQLRRPLRLAVMVGDLGRVVHDGQFMRMSAAITLAIAGQFFFYIGAAAILVVDLLHQGEGDFWKALRLHDQRARPRRLGQWAGRGAAQRPALRGIRPECSVAAAAVGVALASGFGDRLPYAVVGPSLIAVSPGAACPTVQVALLDRFPDVRGAAASVAGVLPLVLNALFAGVLAPRVTGSVLQLAIASAALVVLGWLCWVWHLASSRDEHPAAERAAEHEPFDNL